MKYALEVVYQSILWINSDIPSPIQVKDSLGSSIEYNLLSLPFYLLGQLHRLIKSAEK